MTTFKPLIWQLLIGMVFTRTASFMTLPFLAIYMQKELQAPPLLIGLAVGIAPLASTFGGLIGGYLTDRLGRKKILYSSMVGWIIAFFGFAIFQQVWLVIVFNALNGLSRAFFEPSSQAIMIDHTEVEQRRRFFSIRYTLINLSAVIGPLVGVLITKTHSMSTPFYVTGALFIFCLLFFIIILRNEQETLTTPLGHRGKALFSSVLKDHVLLYLMLGSIVASIIYSQTDSTLSQLLNLEMEDGVTLFSILVATNALTVLVLQLPLSVYTEKWSVRFSLILGSVFSIIGMFVFFIANSWALYIVAMFIISLGEIFIFPMIGIIVEMIAPQHQKATYLGVLQFQSLGGFVGPIIGSWMISHYASAIYGVMSLLAFVMLWLYLLALKKR